MKTLPLYYLILSVIKIVESFRLPNLILKVMKSELGVIEVSFVKRERSLLFDISRYLFASHEVNMPYLT